MALKFRHFVGSMIIFTLFVVFFISINDGFTQGYGDPGDEDVRTMDIKDFSESGANTTTTVTGNIFDQLGSMYLVEGINSFGEGIMRIISPNSPFDLVGGIILAGFGVLKGFFGIIAAPTQIMNIVVTYYGGNFLGNITGILAALFTTYILFVLISLFMGREV